MDARAPQDVQAALQAIGCAAQVRTMPATTATAPQAAVALDTALGSIVKSLCFLADGAPLVVLVAGDRRVSDRRLAEHLRVSRKRVKIADAATTLRVTGYAPGGVPPLGHAQALPVLVDASLARFELLYAAAGSPYDIFPVAFDELVRITHGQILELTEG